MPLVTNHTTSVMNSKYSYIAINCLQLTVENYSLKLIGEYLWTANNFLVIRASSQMTCQPKEGWSLSRILFCAICFAVISCKYYLKHVIGVDYMHSALNVIISSSAVLERHETQCQQHAGHHPGLQNGTSPSFM